MKIVEFMKGVNEEQYQFFNRRPLDMTGLTKQEGNR